jgi:hypothetical protein
VAWKWLSVMAAGTISVALVVAISKIKTIKKSTTAK